MICTCDACHYTFNASVVSYSKYNIPKSCPDCGKKTIRTANGAVPAVRAATEEEIAEYQKNLLEIMEEMVADMAEFPDD